MDTSVNRHSSECAKTNRQKKSAERKQNNLPAQKVVALD
jgi:hypothetical protein